MVDCDNCGAYSDSPLAKSICIHCFRKLEKQNIRLRKQLRKCRKEELGFLLFMQKFILIHGLNSRAKNCLELDKRIKRYSFERRDE